MDAEGYPEDQELEQISKWDWRDLFGVFEFIVDRWAYKEWGWYQHWVKDNIDKRMVLEFKISTAGWSGNESIVNALLENTMVRTLTYYSWRRGGHYVFKINPFNIGFVSVQEYCKEKKVSRQYVYHNQDKFIWISISPKKKLLKPIAPKQE